MTYSFPVKTWDRTSSTGELMELFHTLHSVWERDFTEEHDRDYFNERREQLLNKVQEGKVVMTLDKGGDIFIDCLWDTQDTIPTENNAE